MCRFPKKTLQVTAEMLQQEYCAECLSRGIQPEPVLINGSWVDGVLNEYRLTDRKPNRKFKVPRWVLSERLDLLDLRIFDPQARVSLTLATIRASETLISLRSIKMKRGAWQATRVR